MANEQETINFLDDCVKGKTIEAIDLDSAGGTISLYTSDSTYVKFAFSDGLCGVTTGPYKKEEVAAA